MLAPLMCITWNRPYQRESKLFNGQRETLINKDQMSPSECVQCSGIILARQAGTGTDIILMEPDEYGAVDAHKTNIAMFIVML